MRVVLPLLGVICFAVIAAASTDAALPTPSIHLAGKTLTGAHFLPLKPVTVTVVGDSKSTFLTKPTPVGTFKIALGFNPLSGCGGSVKIRANGPRGEWASLNVSKPLCSGQSSVGVTATASDGSTVTASG